MLLKFLLTIIICVNFRGVFAENPPKKIHQIALPLNREIKSNINDENGQFNNNFGNNKKTKSCLKGYRLAKNRKYCTDINECKHHNGGCNHVCQNLPGTYQCKCLIGGYRLRDDHKTCEDINECLWRNGHGPCDDVCFNTVGSYFCRCRRNGTRLNPDKHTCDDINECQEGIAGCSHICRNAYGRYYCTCPIGMVLKSDWRTCQDIDECKDGLAKNCDKNRCRNTIGSYICDNTPQMLQDRSKLTSFTCPPLYPPKYGYFACNRNSQNHLRKVTRTGRALIANYPGLKCYLNCPVGYKPYGNGEFVCSRYGRWINKSRGFCLKMSKPYLICPADKVVYRRFNEKQVLVKFPRPKTDVSWESVKAHPPWAKNLEKVLKPGIYFISFAINSNFFINSTTKCLFTIKVI